MIEDSHPFGADTAGVADAAAAARAIVGIFVSGDVDAIPAGVADDYVDHQGLGDIEIRGPDGFRQVIAAVTRYSDRRVTIEDLIAAGDKAAVRLRWQYTNDAGRVVTRETLDILRFADGRLAEHWGAEIYRRESE